MTLYLNVVLWPGARSWPSLPFMFTRRSVNVCWLSCRAHEWKGYMVQKVKRQKNEDGKKSIVTKETKEKENMKPTSSVNHFHPESYSIMDNLQTFRHIALVWELCGPPTFLDIGSREVVKTFPLPSLLQFSQYPCEIAKFRYNYYFFIEQETAAQRV